MRFHDRVTIYAWFPLDRNGIVKSCSSVQFSSVQFSSVQFSSVQFSSVQFSSVQFSSVQFSSVQFIPHDKLFTNTAIQLTEIKCNKFKLKHTQILFKLKLINSIHLTKIHFAFKEELPK